MPERLVVIHNPNSTHGREVQSQILGRLDDAAIRYERIASVSPYYDDNVEVFADALREGDRAIIAAGDGTASQAVAGALVSGHDAIEVGFEPYGNFNDLAAGYNGSERPIDPVLLARPDAHISSAKPIRIDCNDQPWRYALGYATVGWTATATGLFMEGDFRDSLKQQHKHLVTARSFAGLFGEYLRRRHDMALPQFILNDVREFQTRTTDIVALNTRRMGRVIRLHAARPDSDEFTFATLDVSSLYRNRVFLAKAALGAMPGDSASSQRIVFSEPADIPIQTEGEFAELHDVTRLAFTKRHDRTLAVVTPHTGTMERNE